MTRPPTERGQRALEEREEPEQLILSDLINRVLDKGVVITANVMISIADIDLVQLDLRLFLTSVATRSSRDDVSLRPGAGA
jgi:gas vesicle structural protein